ncbi:hypothetical protein Efla_004066 [Eimeria flavescens]
MVKKRQRRASAAVGVLTERLESQDATAGPFTLNKLDPKVSISGARVDRQGLHVSLTIPLDSSLDPLQRNAVYPQQQQDAAARRMHRSPKRKTPTADADAATQTSSQQQDAKQRMKSFGGNARLPQPSAGPPVSAAAAEEPVSPQPPSTCSGSTLATPHAGGEEEAGRSRFPSRRQVNSPAQKRRTRSNTAKRAASSAHAADTPSGEEPTMGAALNGQQPQQLAGALPVEQPQRAPPQAAAVPSIQEPPHQLSEFTPRAAVSKPHFSAQRRPPPATGSSKIDVQGGRAHKALVRFAGSLWEQSFSEWLRRLSRENSLRDFFSRLFKRKFGWPFVALVLLAFSLVGDGLWSSWLTAVARGGTDRSSFAAEVGRSAARGSFYLVDGPEAQACEEGRPGLCHRARQQLCGVAVGGELAACVFLGRDVGAHIAGGFIEYSGTSNAAPSKALRVSRALHTVASFAMPSLPLPRQPALPAASGVSEAERATIRQSYFPLYNHDNDPAVLLSDSDGTYIITDRQGQVVVGLSRPASVFAVALQTPQTLTEYGQCGPLEIRWFSVYVHLNEKHSAACPAARAVAGQSTGGLSAGAEGHWCEAGDFEYSCIGSEALQVFCLSDPVGLPSSSRAELSHEAAACGSRSGWPTDRVDCDDCLLAPRLTFDPLVPLLTEFTDYSSSL